jgi:FkbH-like protein
MSGSSNGAARNGRERVAENTAARGPEDWLADARQKFVAGETAGAYMSLRRVADSRGSFRSWAAAAAALTKFEEHAAPPARRAVRLAIAGSYTTSQLGPLLRLAALRRGIAVELYETGFDLYVQEVLDPRSGLHAFGPDYVLFAPHEGTVLFPTLTDDGDVERTLDAEVSRWQSLWEAVRTHSGARVIQHRPETALGHLSTRIRGSRDEMLRTLNVRLAQAAGDVLIVDCDRIAGDLGKSRWFDDRFWHVAKQAVALDALPELARHTAAVLAGAEGLSSKCVVLDLDNTLWGGVIAEDGLAGIKLGGNAQGEAYVAFQEYLLALRSRGIILAVVSKNNDADAREPFERHPDMRLRLDDLAVFLANWDDKPTNLRAVASTLDIGLESLVFVDDNPAEREITRQLLPEIEVPELPPDASGYVRALSDTLLFESAKLTAEDLRRADQYKARAAAAVLRTQAGSLEDFYASLGMEALVAPFDELNMPRIAQLVGKTNQFNLTTRRHSEHELRAMADDDRYVTQYLRLRDKFGDHGLVAVLIAQVDGDVADIETWLMSCRVIGRTVENEMLMRLCESARGRDVRFLRGTFSPTAKNGLARDVFAQFGFRLLSADHGRTTWEYDIDEQGIISSDFIQPWRDAFAHA